MTTLSPKQRTATAVERALNHAFPQTAFRVEVGDALDTLAVHWHGGPSHHAVNAVIARAGRRIGFQYSPSTHSLARRLNSELERRSTWGGALFSRPNKHSGSKYHAQQVT